MTSQENYPLDELTISIIADFQRQITRLFGEIEGVLFLYSRQHNLIGPWTLAPNGRELQRVNGSLVETGDASASPDFLKK